MKALSTVGLPSAAIAVGATSPNPGYPAMVWSTTASALLVWSGTAWVLPPAAEGGFIHVRDEKAAGTNAGGSSAGVNERVLNTQLTNTISGASLASNRVTLPAGNYYCEASAVGSCNSATVGSRHKLKLYNYTDSTDILVGKAMATDNSGGISSIASSNESTVSGRFTLSASKVVCLNHYFSHSTPNGLGSAVNSSGVEVYAELKIWKLI